MVTLLSRPAGTRPAAARPKPTPYPQPPRVSRWSALDGVRAFAVVGVMLYHAGVSWIPGGLLGVDVFFVLSGFLISSLLLREVRTGGRIDLRGFWLRRARRLLPALLLVLLAVSLWAALDRAQDIRSIRLDVASSLIYVANWRFAFSHQGYFSSAQSPSPVLHLWSLGVEEQFYLLWPLLVAAAVLAGRWLQKVRRFPFFATRAFVSGRTPVRALALIGIAGSTGILVVGSYTGVDASRLYYGTDTRALALLTGAVLATLLPLPRSPELVKSTVARTRKWTLIGGLAFIALATIVFTLGGEDSLLYHGGFLVVAVLVALVLASLLRAPLGPVSRLFQLPPLVHIGRISYGLYLWHWPVILFFTATRTGLSGSGLLALRIGIAFALAELSYWCVERPILERTFRNPFPTRRIAVVAVAGFVAFVAIAGPFLAVPRSGGSGGASFASKLDTLAQKQEQHSDQLTKKAATPSAAASPAPKASASAAPKVSAPPAKLPGGVPPIDPNPVPAEPISMLLVGDSTAWSAGLAVENETAAWKVNLIDGSRVGCGIAPGVGAGDGDQAPVKYGECWDFAQRWQQTVAAQHPTVSVLVLGHWEVVNRKVDGKVMHIGQPGYDALLTTELEKSVSVLGSAGGKVVLATAPCYLRPERPDGTRYPQDDCSRVRDFNKLIWAEAARHPSNTSVLDLYQYFSPDGKWHLDIDGQEVRDPDGVHFNIHDGKALAPIFLGGVRTLLGLPSSPQPPPTPVKLSVNTGG
jgi:peptidoglycan/LPS O-acetylase OafA/YrhL